MLLVMSTILYLSIGYSAFNTDLTISGEATMKKGIIYTEDILNGTDPVLSDNLIPVIIESNGTVRKASIYEEWYKYENQEWANAVILQDENQIYRNGEIIPESNIESYFVWIPRFKYKIFNEGNYATRSPDSSGLNTNAAQTIDVIFENRNTLVSNGNKIGEWLTHPAFTSFNSNGFWVGKFETGYLGAAEANDAQQNINDSSKIIVKPNVYSWRGIQVGNAFYTSYNYQRELDSHMMKNTEWGAVAYLQHSIYGSRASLRNNNQSYYLTGYAASVEPTCGYNRENVLCNYHCHDNTCNYLYNSSLGYTASTTGNITGIYDMSGGAIEYVMGILADSTGKPPSGRSSVYNSGFKGNYTCPTCDGASSPSQTSGYEWPDKKYYDIYTFSASDQQFGRRILGDATGEMGPFGVEISATSSGTSVSNTVGSWYYDMGSFVSSSLPWFVRGSCLNHGINTGMFAFASTTGAVNLSVGFRIVLTPSIS